MDNFDSAGAIVPGAEAEEPLTNMKIHVASVQGHLLKDDDCDFGWIQYNHSRMKLRDANYVVMQAVKEDTRDLRKKKLILRQN